MNRRGARGGRNPRRKPGWRLRRGLRRLGIRLLRKATRPVRSALKQLESEAHLAPF
ncbi:hypothetical protein [Pigmentiphaga soli]|uniref:hypothetical protein n=1 Tax=Pigmentiphaga soli TaxID=1007095 RepID=UPI0031ED1FD7